MPPKKKQRPTAKRRGPPEGKKTKRCGYTLVSKLGAGQFGTVWKARSPEGREVAVKFQNTALQSQEELSDLLIEAGVSLSVKHPNIYSFERVFFDCENESDVVLVGEIADRGSLKEWLQRNPNLLTPAAAAYDETNLLRRLQLADNIICGTEWLEQNGVVHNDVKPENIFLISDRTQAGGIRAMLGDFGLSNLMVSDDQRPKGTARYMPPERFCEDAVGSAGDWWAVGLVLHELFFDRHPIKKNEVAPASSSAAVVYTEVDPLVRVQTIARFAGAPPTKWLNAHPTCKAALRALKSSDLAKRGVQDHLGIDFGKYRTLYGHNGAVADALATVIDQALQWDGPRRRINLQTVYALLPQRAKRQIVGCTNDKREPQVTVSSAPAAAPEVKWVDAERKTLGKTDPALVRQLWYRLHCVAPRTYGRQPTGPQRAAVVSLAARVLNPENTPKLTSAVRKVEREMIKALAFNFYASDFACVPSPLLSEEALSEEEEEEEEEEEVQEEEEELTEEEEEEEEEEQKRPPRRKAKAKRKGKGKGKAKARR